MTKNEGQTPRKPATKFACLRKKMQKQKVQQAKKPDEEVTTEHPGWTLIVIGVLIAGIGLIWLLVPSIHRLGKLPGDIRIEGENTRIYIPITT